MPSIDFQRIDFQDIDLNDWAHRLASETGDGADRTSWDCTVCGRPRLCPYAAPHGSDSREACRSCGDLLAHICSTARNAGSNLEVW